MEDALSGGGDAQRGGDGLHRERARGIQTCRHRDLAVRHRRAADRPGVHRRQEGATLRGPTLAADFKQMVIDYIERRWGKTTRSTTDRSNVEEYSSFA